jgi:hypothetical protein
VSCSQERNLVIKSPTSLSPASCGSIVPGACASGEGLLQSQGSQARQRGMKIEVKAGAKVALRRINNLDMFPGSSFPDRKTKR